MSKTMRILFAGAGGLLAFLLCILYGNAVRAEAESERTEALEQYGGSVATVIVASRTLRPGDELSTQNVEEREWLSELIPEDSLTALEDAVGCQVSSAVAKGSPLTKVSLEARDSSVSIPSGKVAISVPLGDRSGITRDVAQGSNLCAYEITQDGPRLISVNVTVLATPETGTSSKTVTVAVPLGEVASILSASNASNLVLVQPADDLSDFSSVSPGDVAAADTLPYGDGQIPGAPSDVPATSDGTDGSTQTGDIQADASVSGEGVR